jgi:cytochrome b561
MPIKNTNYAYGAIAKWLHWSIALLFLCSYITVKYRHWFTEEDTPANWTALQLHLSVGITIACLVIIRIIWRLMNTVPEEEPGNKLMHIAAKYGHYALYGMMVIMPLTGYIGTGVNTEYFFLFDIPKFETTPLFASVVTDGMHLAFKQFEKPIDYIHKDLGGELIVLVLIGGHVLAALYHHFIKKDRTIKKMTVDKA